MNAIADTGLLVALGRQNDQYHDWAAQIAEQIRWPVLTCEAVLAETAFHLESSEYVLGMLKDKIVRLAFDCTSHLDHLYDLATRYADRHPDLADLCLIRMSELYPRHTVITVDHDFRVYRRNKREAIPLLSPPRK
ncbi:MAG: PIN domain-containing protein [Candidatus Sulfotelmatobacter sp.]